MWKYIRVIFFNIIHIIYSYFTFILPCSRHPNKMPLEKRYKKIRKLVLRVLKYFKVDIRTNDLKDLFSNNKSSLIVCNHMSDIDPLIFIALSEKPITFAGKKETEKYPLVGRCIKILEGKFLDRQDLKQQLRVMKEIQISLETNDNLNWVIYPEGTRNKKPFDENILEFHHGTFRCAYKAKRDIYICAMFGTFRILKIDDKHKKYPVNFQFITKISALDYQNMTTTDISEKAYTLINEEVKKLREIDKELISKY